MIQNYSIIYLPYILQYFGSRYIYLGTGDNQELAFTNENHSQYVIISARNTSITIHCEMVIQEQFKQNILQIG